MDYTAWFSTFSPPMQDVSTSALYVYIFILPKKSLIELSVDSVTLLSDCADAVAGQGLHCLQVGGTFFA